MTLYLLDTDTFSLLQTGHPEVSRRVRLVHPSQVATTLITVEEVLTGWYTFVRQARRPDEFERGYERLGAAVKFLSGLALVNYTTAAMARFDTLTKAKLNVKRNDLRIAAIALEHGAVVVTRNVRDFQRVPNLAVEDWIQPAAP